jgi:hypothetical protein
VGGNHVGNGTHRFVASGGRAVEAARSNFFPENDLRAEDFADAPFARRRRLNERRQR